MVTAIRETVTVKAGGVVEVRSPALHEGDRADVIVLVDVTPTSAPLPPASPAPPPVPTWGAFLGSAPGRFGSVAAVDAYIRELRDEWDR